MSCVSRQARNGNPTSGSSSVKRRTLIATFPQLRECMREDIGSVSLDGRSARRELQFDYTAHSTLLPSRTTLTSIRATLSDLMSVTSKASPVRMSVMR